jgi:hypothetical protein
MWSLLLANWRAVVIAGIVSAAFAAGFYTNGVRWQSKLNAVELKHSQALAAGYKASLEKYAEANQRAIAAEKTIQELRTRAGKKTIIYRDAVKGDPKCAEQASQPLVCPRPW